ncbi:ead/Ea22-like family protein [Enterobacter roggenkampii]|uniref:ead/Ea22-like family protein n=1 Tax=Enterobacter roggenkampii TaxID=1812935 RepID=UPI002379389E|nr:ead/Ea22-like family protein [Enterobacter roggenkampii]MDD9238221.1 ead/Ea22-like family protein [Enterobacter roggenkampii]
MSNIDKQALREAAEKAITDNHTQDEWFHYLRCSTPETVLALLDEQEAAERRIAEQADIIANQNKWVDAVETTMISTTDRAEAAEKRIAELPGQKRLIGWRMADYTDETADPALAKNWATVVGVLPIFEGDVNTKLSPAAAGKGE